MASQNHPFVPRPLFGIPNISDFYPNRETLADIISGKRHEEITQYVRLYSSSNICRTDVKYSRNPGKRSSIYFLDPDCTALEPDFPRNESNPFSGRSMNIPRQDCWTEGNSGNRKSSPMCGQRSKVLQGFSGQEMRNSWRQQNSTGAQVNEFKRHVECQAGNQSTEIRSTECQTDSVCISVYFNKSESRNEKEAGHPGEFVTLNVKTAGGHFEEMGLHVGKHIQHILTLEESTVIENILRRAFPNQQNSNKTESNGRRQSAADVIAGPCQSSTRNKQTIRLTSPSRDIHTESLWRTGEQETWGDLCGPQTADWPMSPLPRSTESNDQDVTILPSMDRESPGRLNQRERIVQEARRNFGKIRIPFLLASDIIFVRSNDGSLVEMPERRDSDGRREILATYMGLPNCILVKKLDHNKHSWNNILREARTLLHLKDTQVVPELYGLMRSQCDGDLCLIQDYINGGVSLSDILYSDAYSHMRTPEIGVAICRQMVFGLQAIHEKNILLNNIEPCKILIETGARVKTIFTDMSLATYHCGRIYRESTEVLQQFPWIAPEVCIGHVTTVDSDMFAFGHVIGEISYFFDIPEFQDISQLCRKDNPQQRIGKSGILVLLDQYSRSFLNTGTCV